MANKRAADEASGSERDGSHRERTAEIKRAVQSGQAQIGERLLSSHANENPLYSFDSIPFIASGFAESDALWSAAKPELEKLMAKKQLVLLYSVPWPPQGLYFKKPITTKADMQGVKFRSYNSATAQIAHLAGMVPVQIEAAELNQALALGVVESMMSSGSTGYDRKVWEQLDYFYDTKAWLPRSYVFANKASFDSLSAQHQNCLRDAAKQAQVVGTKKARELSQWYLQQLAANGMQILEPSNQLIQDLNKIGVKMTLQWLKAMGIKGEDILRIYRENSQGVVYE